MLKHRNLLLLSGLLVAGFVARMLMAQQAPPAKVDLFSADDSVVSVSAPAPAKATLPGNRLPAVAAPINNNNLLLPSRPSTTSPAQSIDLFGAEQIGAPNSDWLPESTRTGTKVLVDNLIEAERELLAVRLRMDNEKDQSTMQQLRAAVEAAFDARQKWQQAEVERLAAELKVLQTEIELRASQRERLIQKRMEQMAEKPPAADASAFPFPTIQPATTVPRTSSPLDQNVPNAAPTDESPVDSLLMEAAKVSSRNGRRVMSVAIGTRLRMAQITLEQKHKELNHLYKLRDSGAVPDRDVDAAAAEMERARLLTEAYFKVLELLDENESQESAPSASPEKAAQESAAVPTDPAVGGAVDTNKTSGASAADPNAIPENCFDRELFLMSRYGHYYTFRDDFKKKVLERQEAAFASARQIDQELQKLVTTYGADHPTVAAKKREQDQAYGTATIYMRLKNRLAEYDSLQLTTDWMGVKSDSNPQLYFIQNPRGLSPTSVVQLRIGAFQSASKSLPFSLLLQLWTARTDEDLAAVKKRFDEVRQVSIKKLDAARMSEGTENRPLILGNDSSGNEYRVVSEVLQFAETHALAFDLYNDYFLMATKESIDEYLPPASDLLSKCPKARSVIETLYPLPEIPENAAAPVDATQSVGTSDGTTPAKKSDPPADPTQKGGAPAAAVPTDPAVGGTADASKSSAAADPNAIPENCFDRELFLMTRYGTIENFRNDLDKRILDRQESAFAAARKMGEDLRTLIASHGVEHPLVVEKKLAQKLAYENAIIYIRLKKRLQDYNIGLQLRGWPGAKGGSGLLYSLLQYPDGLRRSVVELRHASVHDTAMSFPTSLLLDLWTVRTDDDLAAVKKRFEKLKQSSVEKAEAAQSGNETAERAPVIVKDESGNEYKIFDGSMGKPEANVLAFELYNNYFMSATRESIEERTPSLKDLLSRCEKVRTAIETHYPQPAPLRDAPVETTQDAATAADVTKSIVTPVVADPADTTNSMPRKKKSQAPIDLNDIPANCFDPELYLMARHSRIFAYDSEFPKRLENLQESSFNSAREIDEDLKKIVKLLGDGHPQVVEKKAEQAQAYEMATTYLRLKNRVNEYGFGQHVDEWPGVKGRLDLMGKAVPDPYKVDNVMDVLKLRIDALRNSALSFPSSLLLELWTVRTDEDLAAVKKRFEVLKQASLAELEAARVIEGTTNPERVVAEDSSGTESKPASEELKVAEGKVMAYELYNDYFLTATRESIEERIPPLPDLLARCEKVRTAIEARYPLPAGEQKPAAADATQSVGTSDGTTPAKKSDPPAAPTQKGGAPAAAVPTDPAVGGTADASKSSAAADPNAIPENCFDLGIYQIVREGTIDKFAGELMDVISARRDARLVKVRNAERTYEGLRDGFPNWGSEDDLKRKNEAINNLQASLANLAVYNRLEKRVAEYVESYKSFDAFAYKIRQPQEIERLRLAAAALPMPLLLDLWTSRSEDDIQAVQKRFKEMKRIHEPVYREKKVAVKAAWENQRDQKLDHEEYARIEADWIAVRSTFIALEMCDEYFNSATMRIIEQPMPSLPELFARSEVASAVLAKLPLKGEELKALFDGKPRASGSVGVKKSIVARQYDEALATKTSLDPGLLEIVRHWYINQVASELRKRVVTERVASDARSKAVEQEIARLISVGNKSPSTGASIEEQTELLRQEQDRAKRFKRFGRRLAEYVANLKSIGCFDEHDVIDITSYRKRQLRMAAVGLPTSLLIDLWTARTNAELRLVKVRFEDMRRDSLRRLRTSEEAGWTIEEYYTNGRVTGTEVAENAEALRANHARVRAFDMFSAYFRKSTLETIEEPMPSILDLLAESWDAKRIMDMLPPEDEFTKRKDLSSEVAQYDDSRLGTSEVGTSVTATSGGVSTTQDLPKSMTRNDVVPTSEVVYIRMNDAFTEAIPKKCFDLELFDLARGRRLGDAIIGLVEKISSRQNELSKEGRAIKAKLEELPAEDSLRVDLGLELDEASARLAIYNRLASRFGELQEGLDGIGWYGVQKIALQDPHVQWTVEEMRLELRQAAVSLPASLLLELWTAPTEEDIQKVKQRFKELADAERPKFLAAQVDHLAAEQLEEPRAKTWDEKREFKAEFVGARGCMIAFEMFDDYFKSATMASIEQPIPTVKLLLSLSPKAKPIISQLANWSDTTFKLEESSSTVRK